MPKAKTSLSPALDLRSLPGPETITRCELSNGLTVLVRENFTSPSVVLDGDLRIGALWVPREKAGLSGFTASGLLRGTERRTFAEIYEQIEAVGASLHISGGTHTTGVHGKALAEDLPLVLEMAADAVRRPTFPPEPLERLRGEILTQLAIRDDDTGARAHEAFYQLAYPDHPYSIDEDGYAESVKALTLDDVRAFHRQGYGPRGAILTIVGAVRAAEAVAEVEKYFGDWVNPVQMPEPPLPPVARLTQAVVDRVTLPGKTQSDVTLGVPGPARAHPHYHAARLGNSVLGVFGMGGRISEQVREKHGLAYYAATALEGGLGPGAWYAYAGVNPDQVDRAVELMRREIKKFLARPVTAEELADNQAYFIGRLPLSLETNEGVAGALGSLELHQLGLDYLQRYPAQIQAVTRDEVLAVTREFWSAEGYALAIAGPEAG